MGDEARRYTRAYLAFDPVDREEVLRRTSLMARLGLQFPPELLTYGPDRRREIGLDHQIDTCDVFLLFWSAASLGSEGVRREVARALRRKEGDPRSPPEIVPILIEGPPIPSPPPELAHLSLNEGSLCLGDPRPIG